jgi:deuterolysin
MPLLLSVVRYVYSQIPELFIPSTFKASADPRSVTQTNGGVTQVGCTDWWNPPFCTDGVLSYTVSPANRAAFCPLFFTLPLVSSNCHSQDMATTTLHEMTHCPAVYSPETDDKAYGYDNDMRLSAGDAFLNADTYAMYANGEYFFSPTAFDDC